MKSNSRSCIAIATTPLHIIYVIEFLIKHEVLHTDLIILIKRSTDKHQIQSILNEYKWHSVRWVSAQSRIANRYISLFELLFSIFYKNKQRYEYGIFADYGRTILANIGCSKYYWLGDGTKLLYEASEDYTQKENRYKKLLGVSRILKPILRKSMILPIEPLLFTPFQINKIHQELNSFDWLKSKYFKIKSHQPKNFNYSAQVYFFGSYFCEVEGTAMMCDDEYIDIMRRISIYFQSREIKMVYVPHRHELQAKINKIAQLPNIEINLFQYPAEYQFIVDNNVPRHIAAFSSTCLYHFYYLGCVESITSFYIDFSKYGSNQYDRQEIYYNYLRKLIGIDRVIDVDKLETKSNE